VSLRTVRSEWIRIWQWSFVLGGIGVTAAFAALISVFVFTAASDAAAGAASGGPPGGSFATAADIAQPGGYLTALATVSTLAGLVLLVLWALAVANDYSTGLIRLLVQAQRNRSNLLLGKITALALFTVITTLTTTLVVMLAARPLARLEGIDTTQWQTDTASHLLSSYFSFAVAGLVWGLIGLMVAVLTRSAAVSIGIGIGYLLIVESLIGIVAPDITVYLPGGTLRALVAGGTEQLAWSTALGLSVLYGIIAIIVSLLSFRSRAITS
jgi:ABC-type transport system involved in multi-copper enzyme maturation permease subunit